MSHLAEEVIAEMHAASRVGLRFDADKKMFVYDGLDDYYNDNLIQDAERRYNEKFQNHRLQRIKENTKKHGYSVKSQQKQKDGKIKLVLGKRVYGG